jgi:hypothetical protein
MGEGVCSRLDLVHGTQHLLFRNNCGYDESAVETTHIQYRVQMLAGKPMVSNIAQKLPAIYAV